MTMQRYEFQHLWIFCHVPGGNDQVAMAVADNNWILAKKCNTYIIALFHRIPHAPHEGT